jgi:Putative Actinobacterial Holin-X, holin superfamily III
MQTADGRRTEQVDVSLNGSAGNATARGRREAGGERSALAILKSIVEDLGMLIRMELRLAQQEIVAALVARGVGVGVLAAAGVIAFLGVIFLGLSAAAALDLVMPAWLSRLVVALGFLGMAGAAALFARGRIKSTPMVPEETKRTIKEDVEWAKAQLGR